MSDNRLTKDVNHAARLRYWANHPAGLAEPMRTEMLAAADALDGFSVEPKVPLDAGLRFKPVLERASNTREGWIAEMEQAHDGEWVHFSAPNRPADPGGLPK